MFVPFVTLSTSLAAALAAGTFALVDGRSHSAACRPKLDKPAMDSAATVLRGSVEKWLPTVSAHPERAGFNPPFLLERPTPTRLFVDLQTGIAEGRAYDYQVLLVRSGCGPWRVQVAAANAA